MFGYQKLGGYPQHTVCTAVTVGKNISHSGKRKCAVAYLFIISIYYEFGESVKMFLPLKKCPISKEMINGSTD